MQEYEVLIETINPCGVRRMRTRSSGRSRPTARRLMSANRGRYPILDSGKNAAGDTVITTGDGKGVMIRYTFTA